MLDDIYDLFHLTKIQCLEWLADASTKSTAGTRWNAEGSEGTHSGNTVSGTFTMVLKFTVREEYPLT